MLVICRMLLVASIAALSVACASGRAVPRPFPGASVPPTAPEPADPAAVPAPAPAPPVRAGTPDTPRPVDTLVATALTFRGTPYRNGGSDPTGFDCSGFVQYVFSKHGRLLPREVREQYRLGAEIERDEVQPGDLVFFETVSPGASHVGIALGGNEFVHAPSSRGVVRVERYTVEYWSKRFVGARRIDSR
jgi:cell wall-associated NlpC family hydrolase